MSAKFTTKKAVEKVVDEYLRRHETELGDVHPYVIHGAASKQDFGWFVPVAIKKDPPRRFAYYDVLTAVEDELKKEKKIEIQIIPSGVK